MIGIELGAPRGRVARLNWRLIHMASEGLFPQLVVIPLHRDHGVITMAAGKNDVIKLLPPLTVSEAEVDAFLAALDAVLADCEGSGGRNWGTVREIAHGNAARAAASERPAARPWQPVAARGVCLVTGASGFIGGRLAERLGEEGRAVRCLVRATSDTSALDELDVELATGDARRRGARSPRRGGLRASSCTALRSSRTGPRSARSAPPTSTAPATCSSRSGGGRRAARRPLQHHRRLRPPRQRRRSTRTAGPPASPTGTRRPSSKPRRRCRGECPAMKRDPAPCDRLRAGLRGRRRRDRTSDRRWAHAAGRPRARAGRPLLRRRT